MGTRHVTVIIKDKKVRVSQYGQWDGYYDYGGRLVLKFCRDNLISEKDPLGDYEIDKFKEKVDCVTSASISEDTPFGKYIQEVEDKLKDFSGLSIPFNQLFPQFSRDTGVEILNIINGLSEYDFRNKKFPLYLTFDYSWCEFIHIIDLDRQTVYLLTNHPHKDTNPKIPASILNKYKGFTCFLAIKIKEIPQDMTILNKNVNDLFNVNEEEIGEVA